MSAISTIRLRLWVPLLVLGAFTLLQIFSTLYQREHLESELEEQSLRSLQDQLGRFEFRIEYLLRHGQDGLVADEVAQLSATAQVSAAALVGGDGKVMHATQLAWRGRAVSEVLPVFDSATLRAVRDRRQASILLSPGGGRILAYQPVKLAAEPGSIREASVGVMLLDYDLSAEKSGLWRNLLQQQAVEWGVALLLLVVLQLALGRWLTSPLGHLIDVVQRFSAGDYGVRSELSGSGELARLSSAFNQMRAQLADTLRQLEESEARHRNLFETMAQGVVYQNSDGSIIDANPAAERILGLKLAQLKGQGSLDPRWQVIREDGSAFPGEEHPAMVALRTGQPVHDVMMGVFNPTQERIVWIMVNAVPQFRPGEDRPYRTYATFDDLTERKEAEEKIRTLAFYDVLTQLPNRRLLMDRLQQALTFSRRSGHHGALLFIDLDHFKVLNDTQGHDMGDLLLIEVAKRLLACVREGDTVARLGGDEFVVMLEELSENEQEAALQTELVGEKIHEALNQPYQLGADAEKSCEYHSSSSIGISLFRNHGESVEDLLKRADVAMYQAKESGRNAIRFFDPAMQAVLEAKTELAGWLRRAVPDALSLHYQIQVDTQRRPIGAEVLLRCEHPERGMISPLEFIPVAEETGLILLIGQWVLETACAQLRRWENAPATRDLQLAVNVSPRQFRQPQFVDQVRSALAQSGARADRLKLELTESVVLDDVRDTVAKMQQLRALGITFSLDDFGTGYSSLSYLKRLPLQQVKIDQAFVRDLETDPNDAAIVQAIIAMTSALGLDVIAEGVETEQQVRFLEKHGCPAFQGYLFGRPLPLPDFERLLDA